MCTNTVGVDGFAFNAVSILVVVRDVFLGEPISPPCADTIATPLLPSNRSHDLYLHLGNGEYTFRTSDTFPLYVGLDNRANCVLSLTVPVTGTCCLPLMVSAACSLL